MKIIFKILIIFLVVTIVLSKKANVNYKFRKINVISKLFSPGVKSFATDNYCMEIVNPKTDEIEKFKLLKKSEGNSEEVETSLLENKSCEDRKYTHKCQKPATNLIKDSSITIARFTETVEECGSKFWKPGHFLNPDFMESGLLK